MLEELLLIELPISFWTPGSLMPFLNFNIWRLIIQIWKHFNLIRQKTFRVLLDLHRNVQRLSSWCIQYIRFLDLFLREDLTVSRLIFKIGYILAISFQILKYMLTAFNYFIFYFIWFQNDFKGLWGLRVSIWLSLTFELGLIK